MKKLLPLHPRSNLFRYGFAVLIVVLVTLLRIPLNPLLGATAVPFILYFPAIMLSAWYGGLGPGLLATLLSSVGALYFNFDRSFSFSAPSVDDSFRLGLFLLEGVFISLFTEGWRRSQKELLISKNSESEQREWLQVTLSSIGDAVIVTDADGRVVFMNPVAQSLSGWEQQEAVGKPLEVVFNILNETSRATVENPVTKVLREKIVVGLANHTLLIRKDGSEIPIDDSGAPILSGQGKIIGIVLVFRDVSARRRAEERIAFAASIVESSDDAIIGKSLDGIIMSWNAGAQKIYGYTPDEVIGKHISLLAPDEKRQEIEQILDDLRRGDLIHHYETVRVTKDGTRLNMSLSISPVKNSDGKILGAATIARNITERTRSEAERTRLLSEIEYQRQRLDNVMAKVPGVVWEAWGQPDAAQQQIDFVSEYVKEMLGYSVEEWLATPNFWLSVVHPEDKERAAQEAYDIYLSCEGGTSQFRWVTKDGRAIWV
ncbi:MAG TPA: PAS domain S-box protein, partial [Blastocatellia bacterium]